MGGNLKWCACWLSVAAVALSGCGGGPKPGPTTPQAKVASNLQLLVRLYGQYTGSHQGKSPPSAEEFKKYINGLPQEQRTAMQIDNVESLFVSPRDNQPYKINYNTSMGVPGPGGGPVIAYEQTGVAGKRYVASGLGQLQEVDEAKFKELVPK